MTRFRLRYRDRVHRDDGMTLLITLMVMMVAMALVVLVVSVAISSNRASGRDRQRTMSINAAEAGVDASYALIQSSGTTLTCTWPATGGSQLVGSAPDVVSARATLTYYKSDGTALGRCLTAADVSPGSTFQAVIDGYGQVRGPSGGAVTANRRMQALVKLTPVYANTVDKAIFSDGNISFNNQTTLTGDGTGANADVYTNSDFVCANNENFAGNINSQGRITVQGSCTIAGDAWAKTGISNSAGSSGSIGGRALTSTGNISLPNNFSVNGTLLAGGSISWGGCSATGKCLANASVAPPPAVPFPRMYGNSAAADAEWIAAGYTIFNDNTCASIKANIINAYAKKGSPTLVKTSCAVNFSKDKDIPLSNNLAIYAYGGLTSSQQVSFVSSVPGQTRYLYWVVPYDAVASRPCSSPPITTDNQFNFSTDVDMFVYSPCNISFSNNSTHIGQVYGGSAVSINNKFTMQFKKVPVFGIDPTSTPLLSYKVDIVYKREVRP